MSSIQEVQRAWFIPSRALFVRIVLAEWGLRMVWNGSIYRSLYRDGAIVGRASHVVGNSPVVLEHPFLLPRGLQAENPLIDATQFVPPAGATPLERHLPSERRDIPTHECRHCLA